MEALSKATSGKIVTNLDDLTDADLGNAEKVEEKKIGESEMTFITGCLKQNQFLCYCGGTDMF